MTENENYNGKTRLHYMTIAIIGFLGAAVLADLDLAREFALVGVVGMFGYLGDLVVKQYLQMKED